MITVISGTNRPGNVTLQMAKTVNMLLAAMEYEAQVLDLQKLPRDFVFNNDVFGQADPGFSAIVEEFIGGVSKLVFVVPEYNGSYPGVCKAFLDGIWPERLHGKKAALVGVSSGRGGNSRGLDHLTGVLHYLNVTIVPLKVGIMRVESLMDEEGLLTDEKSIRMLQRQMEMLVHL